MAATLTDGHDGSAVMVAGAHMAAKDESATVLACSSEKDPERRLTIPITRAAGASKHVVMSLAPGHPAYASMPDLAPGDRIEVSAELEVTTDAPRASDAVGKPYGYSPKLLARLLLAGGGDATEPNGHTRALTPVKRETCDQAQHHHRLVFGGISYAVPARGLGWQGDTHLNLVISAHDSRAEDGDVLLVGQNEPPAGGKRAFAKGDMGKLSLVRYRGKPEPSGRLVSAKSLRNSHVAVEKSQPTVVYSMRLVNLKKDEQLLLNAKMTARNPHGYPARVSTQVILTDSPRGSDLHGHARDLGTFNGEIGKFNGTNCKPGKSYTTEKYGTLRMLKNSPTPLYVNLVVTAGDPEHRAKANDAIKIEHGGFLNIRRLSPGVLG